MPPTADRLLTATSRLAETVDACRFSAPVDTVYNPLQYAWESHRRYLSTYAGGSKRVVFLGMNPGPWGMAQTGVPFGEVAAVRDWLGITAPVGKPVREHPKRPVEGFDCVRSEVSGRRLWGLFAEHFGAAELFFRDHFVANYCPLVFMTATGANLTPDRLPARERTLLEHACDCHLHDLISILKAEWVVGVGAFAVRCAERVARAGGLDVRIGTLLHPSPASPLANREWPERPLRQMRDLGLWT
ncbi:MAG: single-strand selective monofunctional uracil-DNA glycosylase [Puniceicoccaceae bacterium]|nr:MAG: single-strand selective monofunctional uracil-DNA glycosylase [Puniceicoccaceae bacterium]